MKNKVTKLGQILSKEHQRSINGGKKQCLLPNNTCSQFSIACAEPQCQPLP
ncbi:hypothetical protein [Abyssalbus ytuae]|uniref:Bacteriocin n=1 Tax=Abyssalbus ytuae TaxID=2926907 RepID=A0A9E7A0X9_9FLAO|nr:hypothetical protein [Abyssalbus ytuae]UOB17721.1 hypothetical protein MQE35_00135 [Abyssalbus ytuae]